MRPPRRPRLLSGEEARLWDEVARLITPLRGRAKPKPDPGAPRPAAKALPRRAAAAPARDPGNTPPISPPIPPQSRPPVAPGTRAGAQRPVKLADLAASRAVVQPRPVKVVEAPKPPGLERRERMGLRRGSLAIDARIDLHGLYQADAHAALVGFVRHARAAGHTRVLVVTGKGGDAGRAGDAFSERGVLRRSVPHWLRGADLGPLVLGFEEAARHHGGAGALYVRLRRR